MNLLLLHALQSVEIAMDKEFVFTFEYNESYI